jgi:hypothetical protein
LTSFKQKIAIFLTFCQVATAFGQGASDGLKIPPFKPVAERQPAFPLKTARNLYSDEEIQLAKSNIAKFSSAAKIKEDILKKADYWVDFTNEEILNIMPDARVPRGFDLCAKGCPTHGDAIFKKGGHYPWLIDPKTPLQVKCPIGGETYPSNDFTNFYKSGFKEKGGGDHVDDGFGWVSPEGDRYWFVAYANQWMWNSHTIPGLLALAQAYLLTNDKKYAEKANLMLYRLAEIYPSMDHENQSRYGLMEKMKGNVYSGKILNRIWETSVIRNIAEAYDLVWDSIDSDIALQRNTGRSGKEIRAFIEANLLEDGLDAIQQGKIAGNFGMHQSATLVVHLVREQAGKEEAIRLMSDVPSSQMGKNGFNYALYNQVFRDGMPLESPGYNAHWVSHLVNIADILKKGGKNLFETKRFKSLFEAPLDIVSIGKFTPDWGDGGSVMGGLTARYPDTYQIGYNEYRDARFLNWIGRAEGQSFTSFHSLFRQALPKGIPYVDSRPVDVQRSRLFAGYGLGILNNPNDRTGMAFTYGMHYSHYHWDFLNVELFANGQKMMPDLGYPDAMNTYVSPVYTWSLNTISHNTVVVDEKRQSLNQPGKLHHFHEGSFARVIDASSPAYGNVSDYRRNLVMVDAGKDQSYVVDFFHVAGGKQHDYSLHGPPGTFVANSQEWSAPRKGTLAGENVEIGELYDNEHLKKNGSKVGYGGYRGSGFQHLFNVQNRKGGKGLVEYHHQLDPNARLRLHTLTPDLSDLFTADAYDRPRAQAYTLKYLIARRKSTSDAPLKSTFVSVFETYKGDSALIRQAEQVALDSGTGHAVAVDRISLTDVILYDTTRSTKKLNRFKIETDATNAVVTLDAKGAPVRVFFSDGTYLKVGSKKYSASALKGVIEEIDVENRRLIVAVERGNVPQSESLVAHFANSIRETTHPIQVVSQGKKKLVLETKDDLLVGKLRIDKINPDGNLETRTSLSFQRQYDGVTLMNEDFAEVATVKSVSNGAIQLHNKSKKDVKVKDVLWLSNVGIGEQVHIKSSYSWEK